MATAANQPTTGATTQNGLNVIDVVSTRYLQAQTVGDWTFMHDGSCVYATYVAYKRTAGTDATLLGTSNRVTGGIGMFLEIGGSGTIVFQYCFGTALSVSDSSSAVAIPRRGSDANIVGAIFDPGNATAASRSKRRVNAVEQAGANTQSGAASSSNAQGALGIGYAGVSGASWTGSIFEVVVWKSPTTAQCQLLEAYLNTKWAIF